MNKLNKSRIRFACTHLQSSEDSNTVSLQAKGLFAEGKPDG